MKGRERIVLIGIVVVAILGAGWILLVKPERKEASKLHEETTTAQSTLQSAEGELASARSAQAQYASAYSAVVNLGKAVPPSEEVSSLIYQLAQATKDKHVEFGSITNGAASSSSAAKPAASAAAASSPAASTASASSAAAATPVGFSTLPFTFVFNGSFFDLEHLFKHLDGFATTSSKGDLEISGRLLTISSVKLDPSTTTTGPGHESSNKLQGTITASAYQLPAGVGLTGPATPGAATPATGSAAASPTTTASAGSPTPAAIVRVNP
jgi:Tfp pilus assembly protein PilO